MALRKIRRVLADLKYTPKLSGTISKSMRLNSYPIRAKLPPPSVSDGLIKASMPAGGDIQITNEGVDLSRYNPGTPVSVRPKRAVLPHFWLRDNCRCVRCVNQDTKQRNYKTFSLDQGLHPLEAHMRQDDLHVTWSDHHRSVYPREFISYYLAHDRRPATADFPKKSLWATWNDRMPPTALYSKVMDPDNNDFGVSVLTSHLMRHGFVFVPGTPATPEDTEKLLERIAFVRVTHYGGFYDFIPDLAKADTAYTNLALPAHTDTTYFTDPAGLQAFHLLSHVMPWEPPTGPTPWPRTPPAEAPPASSASPPEPMTPMSVSAQDSWEAFASRLMSESNSHNSDTTTTITASNSDDSDTGMVRRVLSGSVRASDLEQGGKSLLVDGFYAAELLREQDPEAFKILSTVRLPWHASGNSGIAISPDKRYPVIELGEDGTTLHRIRWNNDDRGVVPIEDGGFSADQWYEAARKWDSIITQPEHEFWVQLKPGTVLIFDNWRVMHGRSAFVGTRRICGGYINRDDWISRWRNTALPADEVSDTVIG
ncbi:hypothetical protein RB597_007409 [Gaeumannomyces tritici]